MKRGKKRQFRAHRRGKVLLITTTMKKTKPNNYHHAHLFITEICEAMVGEGAGTEYLIF